MHINARRLEDGFHLECDLCIVGSGAAGLTLAAELEGTRISVCLLEGGGFIGRAETQDLYAGEYAGDVPTLSDDYLHQSRLRYFGGTTNHWGGYCRPLEPIDFEKRSWVRHSGWPFPRKALEPYYRRAAELLEIDDFSSDDPDVGDPEFPASLDDDLLQGRVFRFRPKRFGPDSRAAIVASKNIRLVLHANAVEIEANESGRAVERLKLATLSGRKGTLRAKAVVLAAGAIENARLLLASRGRGEHGVGNSEDLVGRFFMEHPVTKFGIGPLFLWPQLPVAAYERHGEPYARAQALFPRETVLRERGMLTTALLMERANDASLRILEQVAVGAQKKLANTLDDFDRAIARASFESDRLGKASVPYRSPRYFHTLFMCEPQPNPNSRVTLGTDRDALGVPRVKLDWRLGGRETDSIFAFAELLERSVAGRGLGRMRRPASERELLEVLSVGFHHMGTTRMHDDPKQGVVDADGRMHEVENLWLAGSSVFPTAGAANPTFTILALTLRLADHLKQKWGAT